MYMASGRLKKNGEKINKKIIVGVRQYLHIPNTRFQRFS